MAGELQLLGRIEDFIFSLEVRLHSTRARDRDGRIVMPSRKPG
jgi:hypothetical protein